MTTIRISKALSNYGACSRRDAERFIEEGRVKVNDMQITTPICFVDDSDKVFLDDRLISKPTKTRLWKFFKPREIMTTHRDNLERTTLFELLPKEIGRVISVGRLDYKTEGLILLTNNGCLARTLELPSTNIERIYLCKAHGSLPKNMIKELAHGITVDAIRYAPVKVELRQRQATNSWFKVTLKEGKNREIRNIFEHYKMTVSRLIRVSYGKFTSNNMEANDLVEVNHNKFCEYLVNGMR
jgi:23S rRNA pseudouridine2605 synthase